MPDDLNDTADVDDSTLDDAPDGATGTEPTEAAKPAAPKADASPNGDAKPKAKIDGDFDPERYARTLDRVRAAEKEARDRAAAAEKEKADTLKAVAKALGLAEDDKPDPDALTRQLEEARAQERQRRTENLVLRVAPGLGADPDVLLDSTQFLKTISDLGPDARDDVEDTIRDFLKRSARFALPTATKPAEPKAADADGEAEEKPAKKPAGRSGADMNGAGSKPRQWTQAELDAASKRGDHAAIVAAQEKGLLDDLLGR